MNRRASTGVSLDTGYLIMKRLGLQTLFLLLCSSCLANAKVKLNCGASSTSVCNGSTIELLCQTETANGDLKWLDGNNNEYINFHNHHGSHIIYGINFTLLVNHQVNSDRRILISTAELENVTTNQTIKCSNGSISEKCDIQITNIFHPTWAIPTCVFSQARVQLFWNPPFVGAECCKEYGINVTWDALNNSTRVRQTTSDILLIKNDSTFKVHVYCIDALKNYGPSILVHVEPVTVIESLSAEPSNEDVDTEIMYSINWTTKKSVYTNDLLVCIPQERNSTIMCSSEYNSHPAQENYCSIPRNMTLNVTLNITNKAGFPSSTHVFTDVMAKAYKEMKNELDTLIEVERKACDKINQNLTNCTNTFKEQESRIHNLLNRTCNSTGGIYTIDRSFIITVLLLTTIYIMVL